MNGHTASRQTMSAFMTAGEPDGLRVRPSDGGLMLVRLASSPRPPSQSQQGSSALEEDHAVEDGVRRSSPRPERNRDSPRPFQSKRRHSMNSPLVSVVAGSCSCADSRPGSIQQILSTALEGRAGSSPRGFPWMLSRPWRATWNDSLKARHSTGSLRVGQVLRS